MKRTLLICLLGFFLMVNSLYSQNVLQTETNVVKEKEWYEKIKFGGYMQVRYNNLFETNPDLECEQCDHYWGNEGGGFSFRRLRFKFSGYLNPRIYFYIQPDYAKSVGGKSHVGTLKDAYFDIGFDKDNEYRIRIGQSKVPFGYENLQSSSDRLPLDRNDAINSGLKDERDLGVFFYWASKEKRDLMKRLKEEKLKHSGDFGIFALGIYNGQTGNNSDENNKFHVVTRFTYPLEIGNQIIEPGIQAYTGKFVLLKTSEGVIVNDNSEYLDQRIAASFVLYPKPFGVQAEYTVGKGPEFNKITDKIETQNLEGGYVTLSYFISKWNQYFIPFTRAQYYNGGKKQELDARSYKVNEYEVGVEWHPMKNFELVAMYTYSKRRYEDYITQENYQKGSLLRLQAQLKF